MFEATDDFSHFMQAPRSSSPPVTLCRERHLPLMPSGPGLSDLADMEAQGFAILLAFQQCISRLPQQIGDIEPRQRIIAQHHKFRAAGEGLERLARFQSWQRATQAKQIERIGHEAGLSG
jgi:hypothetical protein